MILNSNIYKKKMKKKIQKHIAKYLKMKIKLLKLTIKIQKPKLIQNLNKFITEYN